MAAAKQRDKEVCSECGFDCGTASREWYASKPNLRTGDGATYQDYEHWLKRPPPKAEYDHIIPFSEGGLTILENIRTLCSPCHKKRTREWHADRKAVGN